MVAGLDSYLALDENPDQQLLQTQQDDDPYEAVETLSLCDLPTHGDSAHWDDDFSKEYQSSSFDRDGDNFFEFFSEEFTASAYDSENKDIIFCGKKLISYINEAPHVAEEKKTTKKKNTETSSRSSTKKWGLFRWRMFRRSKPKVVVKCSKPSRVKDGRRNTISFPMSKSCKRCDPSVWKVSVLNRSKSKWHLFMFGITKYPTEMELRDIKNRQSRRYPSTMVRAKCEASNEVMGKGNKEISSNNSSSKTRAKGLWGLLRVLGCSTTQHRNTVAF